MTTRRSSRPSRTALGAAPRRQTANGLVPQTSDTLPLTALVVVLIVAAVAIVALVVLRKRNAKQNEQK